MSPPPKRLLLLLVCLALPGCAAFTPPIEHPVITDNLGPYFGYSIASTLATTADRRIVLVRTRRSPDGGVGTPGHFCAEPPPDAAENIASKVAAALEASVKTVKAEGAGTFDFARELATTVQSLFHRTQGLQLFRDGAFSLCQALMNESITREEYVKQLTELRLHAVTLIENELALTGGFPGGSPPAERAMLGADGAGDRAQAASPKSERLAALRLVTEFKLPKEAGKSDIAKVKLAQLHDVLSRNATEGDATKRTLTDDDMRLVLDRLRPLAREDQQKKLAVPADMKGLSREQFEQLFF